MVQLGAVLAHDMTLECVIAKVAYLLGKGFKNSQIKKLLNEN